MRVSSTFVLENDTQLKSNVENELGKGSLVSKYMNGSSQVN